MTRPRVQRQPKKGMQTNVERIGRSQLTYRSVAWRETVLGGGEEYFDGKGLLTGAYLETDYGAYCSGSSSSQKFGTIPSCPSAPITEDLCLGGGA